MCAQICDRPALTSYHLLCSTGNPVVKDPSWSCSRSCSPEVSAGLAQRTTSESHPKNPTISMNVKSPPHPAKNIYVQFVNIFPTALVQFPALNLLTQKFIMKHWTSLWKPQGNADIVSVRRTLMILQWIHSPKQSSCQTGARHLLLGGESFPGILEQNKGDRARFHGEE